MTNEVLGIILLVGLYILSIMSAILGVLDYRRCHRFSDAVRISFGCGMFALSIFFTTLWYFLR